MFSITYNASCVNGKTYSKYIALFYSACDMGWRTSKQFLITEASMMDDIVFVLPNFMYLKTKEH